MRTKLLHILFVLLCAASSSFGQLDNAFWFAVPEVSSTYADRPGYLRVFADGQDAIVRVSVPANPYLPPIQISVAANDMGNIALTGYLDSLENIIPNVAGNKGLYIESDNPIKIYYELIGIDDQNLIVNSDIFVLKGRHALGLEFYTPFQDTWSNAHWFGISDAYSSIDIVATENQTIVNVTPTQQVFGHGLTPFSVTLNRGQTYSVRASGNEGSEHLSGTHITSDKPIGVTVKDDAAGDEKGFDLIGDQITPVRELGTEHVVIEGDNYLLAAYDNTQITMLNVVIATLDAGEQFKVNNFAEANYISSSKPIYVFHIGGDYVELAGGQIPHLECTGEDQMSIIRTSAEHMKLFVLTKTGNENSFTDNVTGNFINPNGFTSVPNSNIWVYQYIEANLTQVPIGQILRLSNSSGKFHVAVNVDNYPNSGRFGYFASYSSLEFGIELNVCDEITLDAGFNRDSYLWSTGETSQSITIDSSGTYWAKITDNGCEAEDTVEITVNPGVEVELRSDTMMCNSDSLTLSAIHDTLSYLWNTGDTTISLEVKESGIYWVIATNEYDCSEADTVKISPIPFPPIGIPSDTIACTDKLVLVVNDTIENAKWYDTNGDLLGTGDSYALNNSTNLVVVAENECGIRRDSIHIEFREHIIPNIITPNGDGVNDNFTVENLGSGTWKLDVYNRWGARIYSNNDFKGAWFDINIPDQTYYYTLQDETCEQTYRSWFTISR